eukprot:m.32299 g.32299  ORF g.32299 m.32299 type:complete len:195 (+) comp7034_c0_seq2:222-806(+)
MFDRLLICWRILFRRCLALLGLGKKSRDQDTLLPMHKQVAESVVLGSGGSGGGGGAATESWDDWGEDNTKEFEQTGFKSRQEKQAEAIESLFSEMTPKKIKAKKAVAKTLLEDKTSKTGSTGSRFRLAVDPGIATGGQLGELDDEDEDATWGDDVDLADVKAVERAAARRAHEKAVEEKRAAKRAARDATKAHR